MNDVEIAFEKLGGVPHTEFRARRLGEDEHGLWLRSDPPMSMRVPSMSGEWFTVQYGLTWLIPTGVAWWTMLARADDGVVAVDICQPAAWVSPDRVVAVDLDVDCWVTADGSPAPPDALGRAARWEDPVTIVGEAELESNRTALGYSDELVERVHRATAEIERRLRARDEPFATAWKRWSFFEP